MQAVNIDGKLVNGYCTLEMLQAKLGDKKDQYTKQENKLYTAIQNASRFIDRITERFYFPLTITAEKFDCMAQSDSGLWVCEQNRKIRASVPFITVTNLSLDGIAQAEATDFFVYKEPGYIATDNTFVTDRKAIVITAQIGFVDVPAYVIEWCLNIAEVISGLGIRTVLDDGGDPVSVIKNSIPAWINTDMDRERPAYV